MQREGGKKSAANKTKRKKEKSNSMMKGQRGLNTEFALSRSAWTDREKKPVKGDGVRRPGREKGEEEITAASDNRGKVDFVNILSIARYADVG